MSNLSILICLWKHATNRIGHIQVVEFKVARKYLGYLELCFHKHISPPEAKIKAWVICLSTTSLCKYCINENVLFVQMKLIHRLNFK
jgi:hypothetical protein